MTDTSGSESHDQDLDTSSESAAVQDVQETTTEAPSEFEFSDEALSEGQVEEPPTKRAAFLPIAAAVGGVLLLGSVAWWSLKEDSSFSLLSSIDTATSALSLPSQPVPFRPDEKKSAELTPLAPQPSLMTDVAPKTDSSAQKEMVAPESPLGASSSALPSPQETVPLAKPVEPAIQASPAAESVPTFAASATTQTNPDVEQRITALTARAEELQKALDLANQQLEKATAARDTATAQEAAATASAKALQEKIVALEQKLSASSIKEATASAKSPEEQVDKTGQKPTAEATTTNTADEVPSSSTIESADKVKEKPVLATKQKAARKSIRKTTKAPSQAKPVSSLVLRAVSSGRAWVAKNTTSSELTEVIVGDTVAGIGTVKAIEQQGGKWVVRGTKGTIQ